MISSQGKETTVAPSTHKNKTMQRVSIKFSASVLDQLDRQVAEGLPIVKNERGEFFSQPGKSSVGAIRLKVSLAKYFEFIESVDESLRPPLAKLIPVDNRSFQIVVNAPINILEGKLFLGNREVIIL
jgi:hypothetical protein